MASLTSIGTRTALNGAARAARRDRVL